MQEPIYNEKKISLVICVLRLSKYMLDPSLVFAAVSYTRFRWEIKSVPICGKINFLFADKSI